MSGKTIAAGTGAIIELLWDIAPQATLGETLTLTFDATKSVLSDKQGNAIAANFNSSATLKVIQNELAGDINLDKKVDILDLQILINCINSKESDAGRKSRADLDKNGTVNVLDLQRLVNIIFGGSKKSASLNKGLTTVSTELWFTDTLINGNKGSFGLTAKNDKPIFAGQIEFDYPLSSNFDIYDISATGRLQGFTTVFSKQTVENQTINVKVLFYSMSGSSIAVGDGDIIRFLYSFNQTPSMGMSFPVEFPSVVLSDANGNPLQADWKGSTFEVTSNINKLPPVIKRTMDWKIYPNPVSDILNIAYPENAVIQSIEIFTISGQKLSVAQTSKTQFDVSQLKSGMYLISIKNSESLEYKRFVIVK